MSAPFARVPEWLLEAASTRAVQLYGFLDRYANQDDQCWPARSTLADRMQCSEKTVDRAARELTTLSAITSERRWDSAGDPTSNLYTLHRGSPNSGGTPKDVATPRRQCPEGGPTNVPTGSPIDVAQNESHLNESQGKRESALSLAEALEDDDEQRLFDHFTRGFAKADRAEWEALTTYLRNVGLDAGMILEFYTASGEVTPSRLRAAAERQFAELNPTYGATVRALQNVKHQGPAANGATAADERNFAPVCPACLLALIACECGDEVTRDAEVTEIAAAQIAAVKEREPEAVTA